MKDIADNKPVPDDLLSLLIKDDSLSLDDIIDQFLTIFTARQETTANSLSFALYEIIRNPLVEEKLLNEINDVVGERNYVEFDDLAKLEYLGQILEEALRKYPVAPAPVRVNKRYYSWGISYSQRKYHQQSTAAFFNES